MYEFNDCHTYRTLNILNGSCIYAQHFRSNARVHGVVCACKLNRKKIRNKMESFKWKNHQKLWKSALKRCASSVHRITILEIDHHYSMYIFVICIGSGNVFYSVFVVAVIVHPSTNAVRISPHSTHMYLCTVQCAHSVHTFLILMGPMAHMSI